MEPWIFLFVNMKSTKKYDIVKFHAKLHGYLRRTKFDKAAIVSWSCDCCSLFIVFLLTKPKALSLIIDLFNRISLSTMQLRGET